MTKLQNVYRDLKYFYIHNSKESFPVTFGWAVLAFLLILCCSYLPEKSFLVFFSKIGMMVILAGSFAFMSVLTVGGVWYKTKDLLVKRKELDMDFFSIWKMMFGMLFGTMAVKARKLLLCFGIAVLAFAGWVWSVPTVTGIGLILKVIIGGILSIYALAMTISGIVGFVRYYQQQKKQNASESEKSPETTIAPEQEPKNESQPTSTEP